MVLALALFGAGRAGAQVPTTDEKATKTAEVTTLVNSGSYTFAAAKLTNGKNSSQDLPTGYVMDISKDTLVAHLPGYKRTNPQAVQDSTLTCTKFTYQKSTQKNGDWLVTIRPSGVNVGDFGPVRELKLDIMPTGYATLTVSGNKPVSCYGYIKQHSAEFPAVSPAQ